MRKPESSIKMSTAKLVQLKIGGNFQYTANMWPTITQRAAIPRRPSRYPIWVKVVCFIIRSIRNDNLGNVRAIYRRKSGDYARSCGCEGCRCWKFESANEQ